MYEPYYQYLHEQKSKEKYRELQLDLNKNYIDFSTNDYLGLSKSKAIFLAAQSAGKQFGVGATGSRLLSGNKSLFQAFESRIAQDKKTEASLIFNSGFQANVTVLSSLLDASVWGSAPIVFFDKLNHASLYQALFLSRAALIRYQHNDMDHLTKLLTKYKEDKRPKFIVTETIFGMDGDILPIGEIFRIAKGHEAFLYLDEAHATGMIGHNGYGLSTYINLQEMPHLVMGTFSKALGCFGAYVACSSIIKDYLINKCPGFIYSTALSPMVIGAASKAWDLVKDFRDQRQSLYGKAEKLRKKLQHLGYNIGHSMTPIIPIIIGNEGHAIYLKEQLLKHGLVVSMVRPPTVPPGTSRLRIGLNTGHTDQDVDYFIDTLKQI